MTANLLIKNARIFNSAYRIFYKGYLSVVDGRIFDMGKGQPPEGFLAEEVIDAEGKSIIPGLIDIHMHIESSMVTPEPFGYHLATCGVTSVVAEPHEIANVKGVEGIRAMLAAGKGSPIDIFFGVPSSVPSSDMSLETSAAEIDEAELLDLLSEPAVACLGEIMNARTVIDSADSKTNRLIRLVKKNAPNMPIEGHCPRLTGADLTRYIYQGVDSDHTEHTLNEIKERYFNGMCVQLQEKTLRTEIINHIIENNLFDSTALVTDDVMTDKLVRLGHLNYVAKKAVDLGFTAEQAVYCATATPASRMRLHDRGRLRPGLLADFVIMQDLNQFEVDKTFKNGKLVYDTKKGYKPPDVQRAFPEDFYHTMHISPPTVQDFAIPSGEQGKVKCRVMIIHPDRTHTSEEFAEVLVRDGMLDWQAAGLKLAVCFERHGKTKGGRGVGFMGGAMLKKGAIATSCAHDHHNLLVVGENPIDMERAARYVTEAGGGMACALDGNIIAAFALPVAGLLSEKPLIEFAREVEALKNAMVALGYDHYSPIMSLCTTSLPVSPYLKLTDKGLVDVLAGKIVPLIVA